MKKGRERFENRGLWILLGVLCVVIVGLGVGVIIVNSLNNDNAAEMETKSDEDIINDILNTIEPMSIEDTLAYLDEQLLIYGNTSLTSDIEMMKLNACVNAEQFSDAIEVARQIDEDSLDSSKKMNLYSALNKAYSGLGDVENANYYDNKFADMYYEVFDGGEGNDA